MTNDQFKKLAFGNVIQRGVSGALYVVQTVNRDPATGEAVHVGMVLAMSEADAPGFDLISDQRMELMIEDPKGKQIVGFLKDVAITPAPAAGVTAPTETTDN